MWIQLTKFCGGGAYEVEGLGAVYIGDDVVFIAHNSNWLSIHTDTVMTNVEMQLSTLLKHRSQMGMGITDIWVNVDDNWDSQNTKYNRKVLNFNIGDPREPVVVAKPKVKIDPKEYEGISNFGSF